VGDVIDAEHRGLIDYPDAVERMIYHGYSPEEAQIMYRLGKVIPPVQDIITMAVREAFSPAIASKFGQYEEFPADFAFWAARTGLDQEWAERYWAAHWNLPSPEMGYEMLHRGIIGRDELSMLLKALDIMPFWREKLMNLSFRPFTRVDVRRMYNAGVLSQEEVTKAYMELGYDADKAAKMTAFTVALNTEKEKDLSKTDILDGYARGLITAAEAVPYLVSMGYSQGEAEFFIAREDQKAEKALKSARMALVKARFLAGTYSEQQAKLELAKYNISDAEIETALPTWTLERDKKVWLPPVTDLKSWLVGGVISREEYRAEMKARGCPDKYIEYYLKAVKK